MEDRTKGSSAGKIWNDPLRPQQPLASGRWILGAVLGTIALAGVSLYGAICLLFWQGQWQLVFHPVRGVPAAAPLALKYEDLRFDATETGVLQMDGWWIPAEANGKYAGDTILFLRDGSGALGGSAAQLQALHALGINVFAFDYRGFGASVQLHPSEKTVSEDADAAWTYLTGTRHLPPGRIVLYGVKLGAAVAAEAALRHPQTPALMMEDPQPPTLEVLGRSPSLRYLPVRLLFHDRFDPARTLARLRTPKLFISTAQGFAADSPAPAKTLLYFDGAAEPKRSVALPATAGTSIYRDTTYADSLDGFLREYLPASAP